MKITITGASGFIGKHLHQHFQQRQHIITALSLRGKGWVSKFDRYSDVVIHLAGKAHDTANTSSESEYFDINRDLTVRLFDLYLKSDARVFIYFSSVKAVADTVNGVLTEEANPSPSTPYGESKLQAESYILSKPIPKGKRIFIIRPCMIHGPGNKGNLNLLYKIVEKGIPWPLAKFENRRSILSIDNLNFIIERLVEDERIASNVFNVADDVPLSTNHIVSIISNVLEQKLRLWHIPKGIIRVVAKAGDVLSLPLNSERLKKLTESYVVSNSKVKEACRVNQLPHSAEEGLKKTIQSFRV